jgi:hypothetical protein
VRLDCLAYTMPQIAEASWQHGGSYRNRKGAVRG